MTQTLLCPTCLHFNGADATTCAACQQDFSLVSFCLGCGASLFPFANYCYHCGLRIQLKESEGKDETTTNLVDQGTEISAFLGMDDSPATTFSGESIRLFHQQSNQFMELPAIADSLMLGKRSETFTPDLDFRNLPESKYVSRQHARLFMKNGQVFIEDLGSTNGTFINGIPLPQQQAHLLQFGDQVGIGSASEFTLIFMQDQPINLGYLQGLSGQDRSFESELLESYVSSIAKYLQQARQALSKQEFAALKQTASQITIASYNVGAAFMNLLAKQLEEKAQKQEQSGCQQLIATLEDGLAHVQKFTRVFYTG